MMFFLEISLIILLPGPVNGYTAQHGRGKAAGGEAAGNPLTLHKETILDCPDGPTVLTRAPGWGRRR